MKVYEFGKQNQEIIILLHGGGLSWWNYREVAMLLENQYHVIIPVLDGHASSDDDFTSIKDNACRIIDYIDRYYQGSVLLIAGVSLGAQILVEILSLRSHICQFALIESALVTPMKITYALIKPMLDMSYFLIKKKWFAKIQFQYLKIKQELFDDYYQDTCCISKENMIAFLQSNSNYNIKESIKKTQTNVLIVVGEKEQKKMISSAKLLNQYIPSSQLEIKKNMVHGEYSLNYAIQYVTRINQLISKGDNE